ncbi:hypothetical protein KX729_18735 [Rhizobium sp. XQZ8]|uniref:hypothetical protein n=1 Tax=Rhizobium populisoli TaxID=2859785 RepID=UPI001CA50C4D|nr:hypothetical protein [Rhizobium populisoli]MBW6423498.1 hypothetical protein [Rhizobium populisoli]
MLKLNSLPAIRRAAGLALAIALCGSAVPALAADVSFIMKNDHPNAVEVELYSQDRKHIWPGGNEVYYLDDGESKQIHLSCQQGEKICYGAWVSGDKQTYWGTGPNNKQACEDCCYTCEGGETEEINLVE